MVKIFVGNLPPQAESEEIKSLFAQYGTVTECAIIKNFAFVHMDDRKNATKAIRNLHLYKLHGTPINVEASHGKNQGPVKLHVANVEKGAEDELRALFEEYGTVNECSIIKNFAFIHMNNSEEAMDAIKGLDNSDFQGKRIHVQLSKSRPRGDEDGYGPPERGGYWPPRFPGEHPQPGPPGFGRGRFGPPGYPPVPPPPPPPPPRRPPFPGASYGGGDREGNGVVDYYEKYRARPYGLSSYEDRRMGSIPPPPPPPSGMMRERMPPSSIDPYDRRPLPPPPSTFYRDRSPIGRAPPAPPASAGNGYSYERARLSPLSMSRNPMYNAPRSRDPYSDRVPPPPPARYNY
ncbi:RNA-binding protein 4.3 [Clarias gariepinus]